MTKGMRDFTLPMTRIGLAGKPDGKFPYWPLAAIPEGI
jgi:hypothetical protein